LLSTILVHYIIAAHIEGFFHGGGYRYFLVKKLHFRSNNVKELVMPTEVFVEKL